MSSNKNTPVISADQKPHFFKIILEDSPTDEKLLIPVKFVGKYLNDFSVPTKVILDVPGGEKWEVELSKSDGKMCLQNGWKEFAEHYSLKYGYFVVFRYEELCKYHVLVFDMSCTEIEYPKPRNREEDDDLSIEILDKPSSCGRKRGSSSSPCSRPCKTSKTKSTQVAGMNIKSEPKTSAGVKRGRPIAGRRKWKQQCSQVGIRHQSVHERINSAPKRLTRSEKVRALARANSFKSNNPFFRVVLQPSSVTRELNLPPNALVAKHLRRGGPVMLRGFDGRTWEVALSCGAQSSNTKLKARLFGRSWTAFVRDNSLQVGDACVFELIEGQKLAFNVVVFSDPDDAHPSATASSGKSCLQRPSSPETSQSCKDSSFEKTIHSCNLYKCLGLPLEFIDKHIIGFEEQRDVLLQVEEKLWPVKLVAMSQPYKGGKFTDGWPKFAKDNSLKRHDVCVFEPIKASNLVLIKVSIKRQ